MEPSFNIQIERLKTRSSRGNLEGSAGPVSLPYLRCNEQENSRVEREDSTEAKYMPFDLTPARPEESETYERLATLATLAEIGQLDFFYSE